MSEVKTKRASDITQLDTKNAKKRKIREQVLLAEQQGDVEERDDDDKTRTN